MSEERPELPPNIPPGFLGEKAPDMLKSDDESSHGLNAGIIQEWTWETTMIVVLLTYIFVFPLAFVVLWRSKKVPRSHKIVMSVLMAAGIVFVAVRLVTG